MIKKLKYHFEISVILILGLIIRLVSSSFHSYSNDELSAINRLRFQSFSDLMEFGVMNGDMHPAGVQVFMKIYGSAFGLAENVMRLPFILAGTLAVLLVYFIGLKWFDKKVGVLASGLIAFLCFPIIQSELARPYSFGLLGVLCVVFFTDKILFEKEPKWRNAIFLGISFAFCFYTHYFALLFVGFIGLTGLIFLKKENYKPYFLAALLGVVLFLPHLNITLYHLSVGGLQWLSPPDNDWLFQFLFFAFNSSIVLVCSIISLSIIGLIVHLRKGQLSKGLWLSMLWFLGIYLIGHFLSYTLTPLLKFPVMIFAFPFALMVVSYFITRIIFAKTFILFLLIFSLFSTIYECQLFDNKHYATFGELVNEIEAWKKELPNQKITLFGNVNDENYLNFYTEDSLEFVKSNFEYGEEYLFRELLIQSKTFYCGFVFGSRNTPVQFFETALEIYPGIVRGYQGYNSAAYLLHKRKSVVKQKERLLLQYNPRKIAGEWSYNESSKVKDVYVMDEYDEYGPSCMLGVGMIQQKEYVKVSVTGSFKEFPQVTIGVNVLRNNELLRVNDEVFWMGFDIDQQLFDTGRGYFAFKVPSFLLSSDELKIVVWNRSDNPFYLNSIGVYAKENIWNSYTP